MSSTSRTGRGFTLIEMLVVIAIIGILIGLLMPTLGIVRNRARRVRAGAEARQIEMALKASLNDYRKWDDAIRNRTEVDSTVARFLGGQNARGIVFMEFDSASTNRSGAAVDPWGGVYQMALDGDYDNTVSAGGRNLSRTAAVWSLGRDGVDNTGDEVTSW